jgi:hypothetical protein
MTLSRHGKEVELVPKSQFDDYVEQFEETESPQDALYLHLWTRNAADTALEQLNAAENSHPRRSLVVRLDQTWGVQKRRSWAELLVHFLALGNIGYNDTFT